MRTRSFHCWAKGREGGALSSSILLLVVNHRMFFSFFHSDLLFLSLSPSLDHDHDLNLDESKHKINHDQIKRKG